MIRVEGLRVTYPDGYTALERASLTVEPGEIVVLAGPNGGGKTTLLRAIAGIIPNYIQASVEGRVEVDGVDPWRDPQGAHQLLGVTQQDPVAQVAGPTPLLEAGLALALRGTPRQVLLERARRALSLVGLEGLEHRPVTRLSTGQLVRTGLAGVLSGDPQYLLLDEPTGHLDSQGSRVLADILGDLRARGKGVMVASHDPRVWALADKCYTVNRSLAEGCPSLPSLPERPPESMKSGGVVLELRDVWASYPGGPPVLRGVSLEARSGELTAITGPNGAGKTTVLLVASGILKPSQGRITLREKPALLPADPLLLFSRGTLREELEERGRRVPQWALGVADKPLLRASGGELRLAALALVAGSGRRLLLVDEPTVGLDPWNRRSIAEVLLGLASEGYAVVYTTHDDELASLANRVYVVEGGVARRA